MKWGQSESHLSTFCERPGGKSELVEIAARVQAWFGFELPKRPNGEEPKNSRPKDDQRKRARDERQRSREQPRTEVYPPGYDPWKIGEEFEDKRRKAMKTLTAARKELSNYGRVTEELKGLLHRMKEECPESETKAQIEEFLVTTPLIERMNELRKKMTEDQAEALRDRLERGEIKKEGFALTTEGLISHEGDHPGATSSTDPQPKVSIRTLKVIKIEINEEEESKEPKFAMMMIMTVIVTIAVQWLLGLCRRHHPITTIEEVTRDPDEEEDSEDFEVISNNEDDEVPAERIREVQEEHIEEQDIEPQAQIPEEEEDPEPPVQNPQQEEEASKKLCVTKAGEKYHLKRHCDTL
jgi:hypothetical protein